MVRDEPLQDGGQLIARHILKNLDGDLRVRSGAAAHIDIHGIDDFPAHLHTLAEKTNIAYKMIAASCGVAQARAIAPISSSE